MFPFDDVIMLLGICYDKNTYSNVQVSLIDIKKSMWYGVNKNSYHTLTNHRSLDGANPFPYRKWPFIQIVNKFTLMSYDVISLIYDVT